jgi:TonB family protein
MRRFFPVLYCVAALLLSVPGNCQTAQSIPSAPTEGRVAEWMYGEHIPAIPGKPFSAKVVLEMTNQLTDGALITHTTYNVDARDMQGHTRNEARSWINPTTSEEPRLTRIELYDPATRTRTNLFPLNKLARQWVVGTSSTSQTNPAAMPETRRESLGSDVMEGLHVQGTRTTQVYPAGAMGNDRPLTIVTESWFSEDLRIALLTRRNDPRYGAQTVRVTELSRQEPDASLFDIPKDYKVTNENTTSSATGSSSATGDSDSPGVERVQEVAGDVGRVRIGGRVEAAKLINRVQPIYPALARQTGIQGAVKLHAILGKDGSVQQLQVISGHPLLVQASLDAVRQWIYQPTLLEGKPVEVDTEIDVLFQLQQQKPHD